MVQNICKILYQFITNANILIVSMSMKIIALY